MVASALWRSEARRVVPWQSQGTTLSTSDLHNALATILNPFYNMGIIKMKNKNNAIWPKVMMLLLSANFTPPPSIWQIYAY